MGLVGAELASSIHADRESTKGGLGACSPAVPTMMTPCSVRRSSSRDLRVADRDSDEANFQGELHIDERT